MSNPRAALYEKAFVQYLRRGTPIGISIKALMKEQERVTPRYLWLTSGDEKVRPSHAANDGRIFYWSDPPPTGHPGEEINCRCVAVPYVDVRDIALFNFGVFFAITPVSRARVMASRVLREAARRLARREEGPSQKPESSGEILLPNGQPIGKQGMRPEVRIVKGGTTEARKLFDKLTKNGVPEKRVGYPGIGKRLPNGDWIGYRAASKSGSPTIDIDVKGINFDKIHFYE